MYKFYIICLNLLESHRNWDHWSTYLQRENLRLYRVLDMKRTKIIYYGLCKTYGECYVIIQVLSDHSGP